MGARPVVAEHEASSADDGFRSPNPGDRCGAGAGDHQPAVGVRMGADARGHRVVRRPHEAQANRRASGGGTVDLRCANEKQTVIQLIFLDKLGTGKEK